jgi:hypothetical protein
MYVDAVYWSPHHAFYAVMGLLAVARVGPRADTSKKVHPFACVGYGRIDICCMLTDVTIVL